MLFPLLRASFAGLLAGLAWGRPENELPLVLLGKAVLVCGGDELARASRSMDLFRKISWVTGGSELKDFVLARSLWGLDSDDDVEPVLASSEFDGTLFSTGFVIFSFWASKFGGWAGIVS